MQTFIILIPKVQYKTPEIFHLIRAPSKEYPIFLQLYYIKRKFFYLIREIKKSSRTIVYIIVELIKALRFIVY